MRDRVSAVIGAGLLLTAGYVCAIAWAADDDLALFAGAVGIGLGAMLLKGALVDTPTR